MLIGGLLRAAFLLALRENPEISQNMLRTVAGMVRTTGLCVDRII
jgi:hypothetical protein